MDDDASHGAPGTDLVPLAGGRAVPRELALAADAALGAGTRAARLALRVGGASRDAARLGVRAVAALPGTRLVAGALSMATRPLVADGARVRRRTVEQAQRALEQLVPAIVELVDVDAIVTAIDVDALLARTDVNALLTRVDVDAFLEGVDLDALIARIDVDAIAARIDVNAVVQRVDVDAVVEETELGTIVARSTSGFASEALDVARAQTVGADTLVARIVDRLLRRREEGPLGPPLLVRDEQQAAEPPE